MAPGKGVMVCGCAWSDGVYRYMMYIRGRKAIYMLDRDNAVFQVPNLVFPSRPNLEEHVRETLLDGVSVSEQTQGFVVVS